MPHQLTFADSKFHGKHSQTRKPIFLSRMACFPLETMLRIHCMQHWYNLSDETMEDALYDIASMRLLTRLPLDHPIPDRTTIMSFRPIARGHHQWLSETGIMMTQGV